MLINGHAIKRRLLLDQHHAVKKLDTTSYASSLTLFGIGAPRVTPAAASAVGFGGAREALRKNRSKPRSSEMFQNPLKKSKL